MDWLPPGSVMRKKKPKTKQTRRVLGGGAFSALELASLARCRAGAQAIISTRELTTFTTECVSGELGRV